MLEKEWKTYFGFWEVGCPAVDATFEEVDFGQDELIVKTFEFGEEGFDKCKGGFILVHFELTVILICSERYSSKGSIEASYMPTRRVSRLCLRNIRFSDRAHSMFSFRTSMRTTFELGIGSKKLSKLRTKEIMG